MSYSEIKFKIADENPSGANDNDSLTIYRMVAEDPYDTATSAFKGGATTFSVTPPVGTGTIEWQDPSAVAGVPYFYRFVFGRSSTSSTSSPSAPVGPLMLQGADSFGYPNNIPSHESGVPNYIDVEPLIHIDAQYEEAARGSGFVYGDDFYQNLPHSHSGISLTSKRAYSSTVYRDSIVHDWVDSQGTNHGIPIISRAAYVDSYDGTGPAQPTQNAPWNSKATGVVMDEGVTVLTVSAGSHQMGDGAINASANTGCFSRHMTGSTRYQKFSNWKAQLSDSSIPTEHHIPEYLIRDEALIQAGTITRSHLRQGLPASPDPTDPDNINHAMLGEYSNYHQSWWGTFNQQTGQVRAELYSAAAKGISPYYAIDETKLNLGVYRADNVGNKDWYWNGQLIGHIGEFDQTYDYTRNSNPASGHFQFPGGVTTILGTPCPNWTHLTSSNSAPQFTSKIAGQGYMNWGSSTLHLAFGAAEIIVLPKYLTGEMFLRAVAYLTNKYTSKLAPQQGHIGA